MLVSSTDRPVFSLFGKPIIYQFIEYGVESFDFVWVVDLDCFSFQLRDIGRL